MPGFCKILSIEMEHSHLKSSQRYSALRRGLISLVSFLFIFLFVKTGQTEDSKPSKVPWENCKDPVLQCSILAMIVWPVRTRPSSRPSRGSLLHLRRSQSLWCVSKPEGLKTTEQQNYKLQTNPSSNFLVLIEIESLNSRAWIGSESETNNQSQNSGLDQV